MRTIKFKTYNMKYLSTRSKIFKSRTEDGDVVKNRVFLTRLNNDEVGVGIVRRCLSDKEVTGWEPLKKMNGLTLYDNSIHIRRSSLVQVINLVTELHNECFTNGSD